MLSSTVSEFPFERIVTILLLSDGLVRMLIAVIVFAVCDEEDDDREELILPEKFRYCFAQ